MTISLPSDAAAPVASLFHYESAFARNIGWVTNAEQAILRGKRVAIAGGGGVGGVHLLTLARLGIGAFHIAISTASISPISTARSAPTCTPSALPRSR